MRKSQESDESDDTNTKSGLAIEITGGESFGIVPRDVLRDRELTRSARWLFAVLCTHAGKDGKCRRSLEKIAKDEGAVKRSVQNWMYELEVAGRVEKLNDTGKMGVYRVIRDPAKVKKAKRANLMRVTRRRMKFGEYGRQGAAAKAEKRTCSANGLVKGISPPRENDCTGTGVQMISPEQDPLEQDPLNSDGARVASPPDGGAAHAEQEASRRIEDGVDDRAERSDTEDRMNGRKVATKVPRDDLGGGRDLGQVIDDMIEDGADHLGSQKPGEAGKTNGDAAAQQREMPVHAVIGGTDAVNRAADLDRKRKEYEAARAATGVDNLPLEEREAWWLARLEARHAF